MGGRHCGVSNREINDSAGSVVYAKHNDTKNGRQN